jgi:hypothetical protein
MIVTISDTINNGKGKPLSIVSNLTPLQHYHMFLTDINHEMLEKVSTVIFNYNEDLSPIKLKWCSQLVKKFSTTERYENYLKKIARQLSSNVRIINNPLTCFQLRDKLATYEAVRPFQNEFVKVPCVKPMSSVNETTDFKSDNVIIKKNDESHGSIDFICPANNVLKHKDHLKEAICIQYIDSRDEKGFYNSLRIYIVGDKIIFSVYRPSKNWNVHTEDIDPTAFDMTMDMNTWINNNKFVIDFVKQFVGIHGEGLYVLDFLYCHKEKVLYFCEGGLKYFDDTIYNYVKRHFGLEYWKYTPEYVNSCLCNFLRKKELI